MASDSSVRLARIYLDSDPVFYKGPAPDNLIRRLIDRIAELEKDQERIQREIDEDDILEPIGPN